MSEVTKKCRRTIVCASAQGLLTSDRPFTVYARLQGGNVPSKKHVQVLPSRPSSVHSEIRLPRGPVFSKRKKELVLSLSPTESGDTGMTNLLRTQSALRCEPIVMIIRKDAPDLRRFLSR